MLKIRMKYLFPMSMGILTVILLFVDHNGPSAIVPMLIGIIPAIQAFEPDEPEEPQHK